METISEVIEDLSDHSENSPLKTQTLKPTALAEPRDISSPTTPGALLDTKEPSPNLAANAGRAGSLYRRPQFS